MDPNEIRLERTDDSVVVASLAGEHDIYTAPALRDRMYGVIAEGRPLVVDLTEATFVDSSILGALLGARRRAHEAGLGFAVCCHEGMDPGVRRILDVTGLVPVLPVMPDREAAFDAVRTAPAA
jgi:anti-sigma B factor antagonist